MVAALAVIGVGAIGIAEQYNHVGWDYDKLACLLTEAHIQPLEGERFKKMAIGSRCGSFSEWDTYTTAMAAVIQGGWRTSALARILNSTRTITALPKSAISGSRTSAKRH